MASLLSLPTELRSEIWRLVYQPEIKHVRKPKNNNKQPYYSSYAHNRAQTPAPPTAPDPYTLPFTIDDIETCRSRATSLEHLCRNFKKCTALTCPKGVISSIVLPGTLCRSLRAEIERALWTYCTFAFRDADVLEAFVKQRARRGLPLCRRMGLFPSIWLHAPTGRFASWEGPHHISGEWRRMAIVVRLGKLCGGDVDGDGGEGGGDGAGDDRCKEEGDGGGKEEVKEGSGSGSGNGNGKWKGGGDGKGIWDRNTEGDDDRVDEIHAPLHIPLTHLYLDMTVRLSNNFPKPAGSATTTTVTHGFAYRQDWRDASAEATMREAVANLPAAIQPSGRILVTCVNGIVFGLSAPPVGKHWFSGGGANPDSGNFVAVFDSRRRELASWWDEGTGTRSTNTTFEDYLI